MGDWGWDKDEDECRAGWETGDGTWMKMSVGQGGIRDGTWMKMSVGQGGIRGGTRMKMSVGQGGIRDGTSVGQGGRLGMGQG